MTAVASQFQNAKRQRESAELGIWVFLATEIMFFAPLFLGYSYGRWAFAAGFAAASRQTDVLIGTLNTAVLLTSSLMVALAVRAMRLRRARETRALLRFACALGLLFLALKGLEYHDDWKQHLIPWLDFRFEPQHQRAAALFYFLYFGMTGLHALHLIVGVTVLAILAARISERRVSRFRNQLEVAALYWHFVDAIWVFLYPLIYLIDRHG